MSNLLYRLGRFAVRRRRWVLGGWVVAFLLIGVAGNALGGKGVDDFSVPGTESQAAIDLLEERFDTKAGAQAQIVVQAPEGSSLADPTVAGEVEAYLASVTDVPHVVEADRAITVSPTEPSIGLATVRFSGDPGEIGLRPGRELVEAADGLRDAGFVVEFGGEIQFDEAHVGGAAEMIGLGVAVLVLLVAFGSVVAMGLPIGTALIGLGAGLGLITVGESFLTIPTVAPTLATMIGLGVGIDYALFIVTRHREHLHHGMTVEESAGRALATAGQAVVFAGVTVVIAISGLQFAGIPMMAKMGYATALVVLVSVVAVSSKKPALLGFAGHAIDKLRVPGVRAVAAGHHDSIASRWSRQVAERPWRYLLLSLAILGAMLAPFFSIRLGMTDAGTRPTEDTTRRAYDLVAEGFGAGTNGPLMIMVEAEGADLEVAAPAIAATIQEQGEGVQFAMFDPATGINGAGDTAVLTVIPESAPQDAATQDLVHQLRDEILPAATEQAGTGEALVTGGTAFFIDMSEKVESRLPTFIGAVLLMSCVLLMLVFRSILVPLKAALMNLLGIGAAYGVVVAIFQWGWGASLIGVEESLPIISFLPMFMFAILFGLSMDYEVFLMSRVREEYLRTGDNTASVTTGISHTARVITAAAIIMVSVFGAFALGDDPTVKMMGIGLATAIFLDATLIRMVLVPSTMRLLGDRNWWLPGWLDRILPNLDIEGEGGLPEPEYEAVASGPGAPGWVDADEAEGEDRDQELVRAR